MADSRLVDCYHIWYILVMAGMHKTTVYLDPELALGLREVSRSRHLSQAEVIREAIRAHLRAFERPQIRGIGSYASAETDTSERAESILRSAARNHRS